ncbi:MAG: hypothetical protein ACI9TV_000774 [Sulfurimonas sp.]|jgi:hypothetical protein|uniref:hypothetical protein n=1 Tax=Sulfurimonas sp. TaxID=2022749 RepID=UPI0039E2BB04
MEVSSNLNSFQNLQQFQKKLDTAPNPVGTQPVKDEESVVGDKLLYEGSDANLVRNQEGDIALTPQAKTTLSSEQETSATQVQEETQAQQDAKRENGVDYIGAQSKKSQVEIYLAVATDNKVEFSDDKTPSIIESLRDVQRQNNTVAAYATYQENQKSAELF